MYTHSNDELKEIDIKNGTLYYFDDTKDFNLDDLLVDEKSYEKILVRNISYIKLNC